MEHTHEHAVRHRVATLGPAGTDAEAEARRFFDDVVLADSFEGAMRAALDSGTHALVAAGFVQRTGAQVTDLWVDLHFRHLDRMRIVGVWESPTKPMCAATGPRVACLADVRSIALHPATDVFIGQFTPGAERLYVNAKPLAAQRAAEGAVDGCIGSVDVVERHPELTVREVFHPTMVWVLYQPLVQGELPSPRTTMNHVKSLLLSGA